jgi:hypothetical protein
MMLAPEWGVTSLLQERARKLNVYQPTKAATVVYAITGI